MSVHKFRELLHQRISESLTYKANALLAVAGKNPVNDAVVRGYCQALRDVGTWSNDIVKQMNGEARTIIQTEDEDEQ